MELSRFIDVFNMWKNYGPYEALPLSKDISKNNKSKSSILTNPNIIPKIANPLPPYFLRFLTICINPMRLKIKAAEEGKSKRKIKYEKVFRISKIFIQITIPINPIIPSKKPIKERMLTFFSGIGSSWVFLGSVLSEITFFTEGIFAIKILCWWISGETIFSSEILAVVNAILSAFSILNSVLAKWGLVKVLADVCSSTLIFFLKPNLASVLQEKIKNMQADRKKKFSCGGNEYQSNKYI